MSNLPLKEKEKFFKESKLSTNKELVEKFRSLGYKWSEKEINDRQEEMAEFAYSVVWKFK